MESMITNRQYEDPAGEIGFADIFDHIEIQRMQDLFSDATSVASIITDTDGIPITKPSNFYRLFNNLILTTESGRQSCYQSYAKIGHFDSFDPVINPGFGGSLWHSGTRISVGGRHIANWIIGQVRDELLDEPQLLHYADEIGINRNEFLTAFGEVPIMALDQFKKIGKMLSAFANEISEKSYNNFLLKTQIASRKKIEEELRKSEEKFRFIAENTGDTIAVLDLDLNFTYISPVVEKILGFTPEEACQLKMEQLFSPDSYNKVMAAFNEILPMAMTGTEPHNIYPTMELEEYHKNGSVKWIELSFSFQRDQNNKPIRIVTISRDITSRKLAEGASETSKERLDEAIKLAKIANWEYIISTGKFTASDETFRFLGLPVPENRELEMSFFETRLQDAEKSKKALFDLIENDVPFNQESFFSLSADSSQRYLHSIGKLIKDKQGKPLKVVGMFQDITEAKKALQDLKDSEEKYRKLVELSPNALLIHTDGQIRFVNNAAIRMLEATGKDELIGKKVMDFVHPEFRTIVNKRIDKLTNEIIEVPLIEEKLFTLKGRTFDAELAAIPINLAGKQGVQVVARDITERKQTESMLQDIVDKNPMSIQIVDTKGYTLIVNPAHTALFGAVPPASFSIFDDLESRSQELGVLINLAKRGEVVHFPDFYYNVHDISTDLPDNPLWIQATLFPLKDITGNPEKFVLMHQNITWRKQAEAALRENEQKYRMLVDNAFEGIVIINLEGNILFANNSIIKTFEYDSLEGLIGKSIFNYIAPEYVAQTLEDFAKVINGHDIEVAQSCGITSKGKRIWMESIGKIIDYEGSLADMISIRDITATKHYQVKLSESEEKYRLIAENTSDGILIIGADSKIKYVSPSYLKQIGYSEAEELSRSPEAIYSLIHPDDREAVFASIFKEIELKTSELTYSYRLKHKAGHYIWREDHAKFNYDENGNHLNTYVICRDITERKEVERALKESEEKYRHLVQFSSDPIFSFNTDETYKFVNEAFAKVFGLKPKDLEGKSPHFIFPYEEAERRLKAVREAIKTGNNSEIEVKVIDKSGGIHYYLTMLDAIKNDEGRVMYVTCISKDITERKQFEIELTVAKEKAEESDRLKSAFLANMSHEIRTPMNGILGFAELLKEPGLTGEEQLGYIRIIETSGMRMLNIINDLIDISKIEAGQMDVVNTETNINEKIDFIYTFFKPEVDKKGLKLSYRKALAKDKAIIYTDKEKLYAILTNLVKNAIKYTEEGSIEFGYNTVETLHATSLLRFYVKDTGIGVPSDRLEAIFGRFVQADIEDRNALQGAGLGLAISKAYVEMLGGKIWVESEEGVGSTFYFTIPYTSQSNKNAAVSEIIPDLVPEIIPDEKADPNIYKPKVLIVEDEINSDLVLTIPLRKRCREILHAKTGLEAVEICQKHTDIELILMDIKMPVMNGYDAVREIRKFNKDVIIIAQTAYALSGDREKALDAGCNDYLTKPIKNFELMRLIDLHF